MRRPCTPISKEAKEHLRGKLDRMKGIEKKKTIKRLEMWDRGYRKDRDNERVERE